MGRRATDREGRGIKIKRRTWIKLFVDQTLRGTCFKELEPDERFVWFGFLLLAGDSPIEGRISIQEGVGYTDAQIAALLKIDIGLLERAKAKCIEFDKIRVDESNVIEIVKWLKYQSDYSRQCPYCQRAKAAPLPSPSSDSDTVS